MDSIFSMINKKDDHPTKKDDQEDHHSNKKDHTTTTGPNHPSTKLQHHASNSELFSSAKLVADAAKSTFNHEPNKVDKGKVAGAVADLLDVASHRSKLEESSYGQYVEKAENYLHDYHSKHSTTTTTSTTDAQGHKKTTVTHTETEVHSGHQHGGGGGGGYGDYLKMAQGFMK